MLLASAYPLISKLASILARNSGLLHAASDAPLPGCNRMVLSSSDLRCMGRMVRMGTQLHASEL